MKCKAGWIWLIAAMCVIAISGCAGNRVRTEAWTGTKFTRQLASQAWCLTRKDSDGNVSHKTVYEPAGFAVWEVDDGRIHTAHNKYSDCIDSLKGGCNIEPKEGFAITAVAGNFEYRRDYLTPSNEGDEVAKLTSVGNRYLSGPVKWASGSTGEVFVLYTGTMSKCQFPGITNSPNPCDTFDIELYPDSVSGWDKYRPDGADWEKGVCTGSASPQEPGGGGGHDPP